MRQFSGLFATIGKLLLIAANTLIYDIKCYLKKISTTDSQSFNVIHFVLLLVQSTNQKMKQAPYICHSTEINGKTIQPVPGNDGYNKSKPDRHVS